MGADSRNLIVRPARRDDSAAALADATGIADVLNDVIAQRRYTALDGHWTAEAELAFLQSLGSRAGLFVAEVGGRIAGFEERGVLRGQTKIDGVYFDEVFMELHLDGGRLAKGREDVQVCPPKDRGEGIR